MNTHIDAILYKISFMWVCSYETPCWHILLSHLSSHPSLNLYTIKVSIINLLYFIHIFDVKRIFLNHSLFRDSLIIENFYFCVFWSSEKILMVVILNIIDNSSFCGWFLLMYHDIYTCFFPFSLARNKLHILCISVFI